MPGRIALFSTLVAVNLIVYGSYGWLANYQPDTNSRDPYPRCPGLAPQGCGAGRLFVQA